MKTLPCILWVLTVGGGGLACVGAPAVALDAGLDAGLRVDGGLPDDAGPGHEERVVLRAAPCVKAAASATRCESYEVTCGGAAPALVDVAVFEPAASVPRRGVILFGSGGGGTGFFNFPRRQELLQAGYVVLDRRWLAAEGWFDGATEGPPQAACRYAALARHFKRTLAPALPLCATGNSGGSAELVYALAWRDLGPSLAFALPTSGPFHRLDLMCQGQGDAAWVAEADALRAQLCPGCVGRGYQAGGGILSLLDASFGAGAPCSAPGPGDLARLRAASPIGGSSLAALRAPPIHFLVGQLDENAFAAFVGALHGELLAAGADASLAFLPDVGHELDQFPAGAERVRDELLAHCR
jgi:hypothetical protein